MNSGARKTLDEKKELKRRAILEASVRAFSRHGYHSCTMSQVAKEAGVADGTLYLYFTSKEDMLVNAFRHVMDQLLIRLDEELPRLATPVDKLRRIMEIHLTTMEDDPDLAGFLQFQLRQPDPAIRLSIRPPLTDYARRIEEILEEGHAKGVFRKTLGARAMRRLIFGAMDETVSSWWFRGRQGKLAAKVEPLLDALLNGLLES